MPDRFGSASSSNKAPTKNLHGGLHNRSPKAQDKSHGMKGGRSVNADATRSGIAKTPKSLGPRVA
jgi:hypothetical protein